MPKRSKTHRRDDLQFQSARPTPALAGNSRTATLNSAYCSSPRAGGTPGLLGYHGCWPPPAEDGDPPSDVMGIPSRRSGGGRGGPTATGHATFPAPGASPTDTSASPRLTNQIASGRGTALFPSSQHQPHISLVDYRNSSPILSAGREGFTLALAGTENGGQNTFPSSF